LRIRVLPIRKDEPETATLTAALLLR